MLKQDIGEFGNFDTQMLHGAGFYLPTFARTKSPSFVGKEW